MSKVPEIDNLQSYLAIVMKNRQDTEFKDPPSIIVWLEAALDKEKEKHEACPVREYLVPGYVDSQGWGYVVTGYLLVEQAFKAIAHSYRETKVLKIHPLSGLFEFTGSMTEKETLQRNLNSRHTKQPRKCWKESR